MAGAAERALRRLVDETLERRAAFLVIAGDLFDRQVLDMRAAFQAAAQFERLTREGIEVFLLAGNHDAESQAAAGAVWPDGVRVFPSAAVAAFDAAGGEARLAGRSFGARAEERNISAEYPAPTPGRFNIGVLHTSCDGRPGHGSYAPCSPADLAARGYDYWALGHIHIAETVREDPWIVYPGCLQGRSAKETGPKGAVAVTVVDGAVAAVERFETDAVRWFSNDLDLSGAETDAALRERMSAALAEAEEQSAGRPAIIRLALTGATALDGPLRRRGARAAAELAAELADARAGVGHGVFIERIALRTTAPTRAAGGDSTSVDDVFAQCLAEAQADPAAAEAIQAAIAELQTRAGLDLDLGAAEDALAEAAAVIRAEMWEADALDPAAAPIRSEGDASRAA